MAIISILRSLVANALFAVGVMCASFCHAACVPENLLSPAPQDPVARVLAEQDACPSNAVEFVERLKRSGARLEPTMVNFRGFHNPKDGAFFIFEIVSRDGAPSSSSAISRGDMFFGHFTDLDGANLVSFRSPNDLVIELIAWDPDKQFYNFYELTQGKWVFRGDSKDILDDLRLLHRQRSASQEPIPAKPKLRCSGCHLNGALLQKELAPPHNDWFVQGRELPLGELKPDAFVQERLASMMDAGELSKEVVAAARRLASSAGYRKVMASRSMQEQLRPLFCPMEVNIESDGEPFDDQKPSLRIPSGLFVDSRLAIAEISVKRQDYAAALRKLRSHLPETTPERDDADHAWLTPVKAQSDIIAVDALIEQGVVDKEFVADVLAVDFTNPVFSIARCDLLKLVPDTPGSDFMPRFQNALRGSAAPAAAELLENLSNPAHNAASYVQQASALLANCQRKSSEGDTVVEWLRLLAQRRLEVSKSEISHHRIFHILEPGRIIFPTTQPEAEAGRLTLTPACEVH